VNQYWLHYRLLDNWGYKDLAKTWRKESIEEMWHADKLIERIIFLDGAPNMQTLDSLHIWKTVKAVLDNDLQDELSAHALYAEARDPLPFGQRLRDARSLFELAR
jgi:bacterioferritin